MRLRITAVRLCVRDDWDAAREKAQTGSFRAGRNNQVFAEQVCGHIKRSAGAPIVAYEGGIQLTCENW